MLVHMAVLNNGKSGYNYIGNGPWNDVFMQTVKQCVCFNLTTSHHLLMID